MNTDDGLILQNKHAAEIKSKWAHAELDARVKVATQEHQARMFAARVTAVLVLALVLGAVGFLGLGKHQEAQLIFVFIGGGGLGGIGGFVYGRGESKREASAPPTATAP